MALALTRLALIIAGAIMIYDFFIRAMLAGIGIALIAGPLGCFVIWRQMAFFGETMAHSALLGVVFSLAMDVEILWGVLVVSLLVAVLLLLLGNKKSPAGQLFSNDTLLGILSHSTLALGLVVIGLMSWLKLNIMGFLIGDVLAVSKNELMLIYGGGALVIVILVGIWRELLMSTISVDIARAEDHSPARAELILMFLLALTIAIAIKIVGVLLITALLIIPAATARQFSSTPEQMALLSIAAGIISVVIGLFGSLQMDTPSGPSIVVASAAGFLISNFMGKLKGGASEN